MANFQDKEAELTRVEGRLTCANIMVCMVTAEVLRFGPKLAGLFFLSLHQHFKEYQATSHLIVSSILYTCTLMSNIQKSEVPTVKVYLSLDIVWLATRCISEFVKDFQLVVTKCVTMFHTIVHDDRNYGSGHHCCTQHTCTHTDISCRTVVCYLF